MKRTLFMILIAAGVTITLQQAFAQKTDKKKPVKNTAAAHKKIPEVDVLLGRSDLNGGRVSKKVFDSLLKQGIRLTAGGTIQGFAFMYAERNFYEDSVGNPLPVTDYMTEYCLGDTISPGIKDAIFEKTKNGDTAYFDQIKVLLPNGGEARGKQMKFTITK